MVEDDLAVGRGLENGPQVLQLPPELRAVGDGAVMGHGDLAGLAFDREGLRIDEIARSLGGIPVMADGRNSTERGMASGSAKTDHTRPVPFLTLIELPSDEAIPALSCPRCCRA